ncbi:serine/threonine-protein kinase [Streptomyces sp. NBC_00102]|uniref:serine/threonine-protein kinase n=1 Tax=Streptomyces sp. NBC_00102 TaxID=2975652 RepID=UPI00225B213A|nr:serine/threonine-protein kinase [Streptomyces sp. NBC_00102]MCX5397633.1 serine/threonine protein kinase [Streptomyces sp. NBC_00102]
MQPLEAGEPRTIGAYRLLGRLGAGGMGRVYLGRSAGGRTVAVKVVHPHFALDEQFRARFRREVESARRVGARWTAPVLDADPDAPVPWVATGYVAGPSLAHAVTRHGALPERAVRALGGGLAEALGAVHEQDIVHRDVKPSNVLLALDGPRLIDFGIARALGATVSLTSTGVSVGSPGYMAPEQIRGSDISGAADVFSLGAVLAYAATGSAPFPGDSSAVLLYKVVHEEPELGDLRGGLRDLIAACLAKDPAARPTPSAVAGALAPGGAAALVAAGWLPSELVHEVSRDAVALLDLEPQEGPVLSGPVPFSSASLDARPADVRGGEDRTAAPEDGSSEAKASAHSSEAGSFGAPSSESRSADVQSVGALGVFGPPIPLPADRPGERSPSDSPHAPHGPRFSVSMSADRLPEQRPGARPGRRVSCTVALAVAGALAVVGLTSGMLGDLLPWGSSGEASKRSTDSAASPPSTSPSAPTDSPTGASAGTGSATPSGGTSSSPPAPGDDDPGDGEGSGGGGDDEIAALPKAFVGTWSGPTLERSGASHGTLTAVFTPGKKDQDVVRMTQSISYLGSQVSCSSIGTLSSGSTAKVLKIHERSVPDSSASLFCTGADAELTFTLNKDGTLVYRSYEEAAGLPTGTLTRSGG